MMKFSTLFTGGGPRAWLLLVPWAMTYGCAAQPARAAPGAAPRAVRVVQADRTRGPVLTEVVGTVRAVRSSTVAALISGTVAQLRVGLGSQVRAGEVLVRLSAKEVDARLEQARAMSALAMPERDRALELMQRGAISTAQYDAAISQWSLARAKEAEATAVADHTMLRAPFAGVVSEKLTNVGDVAMPGQALLVVEARGAFRFEARVPESIAASGLSVGQAIPVRLDGVERDIAGTVAELQPAAEEHSHTLLLKLDLPRMPELRSGHFGRLLLATGSLVAVSVPAEAVVRHGQLEGVFVVNSGTARLRLVRSGRERTGRLEIASGLTGDEQIVVAGATDLIDGQRVQVVP